MNVHLKVMTEISFIAFAIIKKANFHLEPDNIGLILFVTIIAFVYNYFFGGLLKSSDNQSITNALQSVLVS